MIEHVPERPDLHADAVEAAACIPPDVSVEYAGETKDRDKSFRSLAIALIWAVLVLLAVLAVSCLLLAPGCGSGAGAIVVEANTQYTAISALIDGTILGRAGETLPGLVDALLDLRGAQGGATESSDKVSGCARS